MEKTNHFTIKAVALMAMLAAVALALVLAPERPALAGTFPGSNGPIAYSGSDGHDNEIFTITESGVHKQITNNTTQDYAPSVSSLGVIAYQCDSVNICNINQTGSGFKQLTSVDSPGPGFNFRPSWSPDGSKIAFVHNVVVNGSGNYEIYVMNSDGSNQRQLTNNAGRDDQPAWSPDGKTIAFTRSGDGFSEIWTMPATGGAPTSITKNHGTTNNSDPSWSPNSRFIVYAGDYTLSDHGIWEVEPGGLSPQPITAFNNNVYEENPSYSPDGTRIAYQASVGQNYDIYTVNTVGGARKQLTSNSFSGATPDWGRVPIIFKIFQPVYRASFVLLRAKVTDGQTNLAKNDIRFYLDGRKVAASQFGYDRSKDLFSYKARHLKNGRHHAKIIARDKKGQYATKIWRFRVHRQ